MSQDGIAPEQPENTEADLLWWRRRIYLGAAAVTGLYLLYLIQFGMIQKQRTSDGFEIIPLFFTTLFWFLVAAPTVPMALLATKVETLKLAAGMLWFSSICIALILFGQLTD